MNHAGHLRVLLLALVALLHVWRATAIARLSALGNHLPVAGTGARSGSIKHSLSALIEPGLMPNSGLPASARSLRSVRPTEAVAGRKLQPPASPSVNTGLTATPRKQQGEASTPE